VGLQKEKLLDWIQVTVDQTRGHDSKPYIYGLRRQARFSILLDALKALLGHRSRSSSSSMDWQQ